MSTGVTHSSLTSATIAYLPGVSVLETSARKSEFNSGHEQVRKTSGHRAGQRPDCEPSRATQQANEATDRCSAYGSNRKVAIALFQCDCSIIVLADDGLGMNCDATLGIELIERSQSFVRFRFSVENYY